MPPILELDSIGKAFPGVRALHGVHFEVRAGEIHALLGENGAGKSTLIKIASGVYEPDEGRVMFDGEEVRFHGPVDAQRRGIATVYQELLLYPELSVAENIFMGHAPRNRIGLVSWPALRRRTRELLDSLDIHDLDADRIVGSLSIGNRQRVEIAKALSLNARVLILDEPTAALGQSDARRLFDILRRLRARDVGIVYISHRLEEVFELADRVTVLRDGEHIATKAVADTSTSELVNMMVGRTIDDLFPKLPAEIGRPVLQVRGLSRRPLTRNISFELCAGEIVGLAGLVGSGRSELAQVLFGITPAESGQIVLEGRPVEVTSPGQACQLGIAYVPEDRGLQGLIRPMTLRENASLAVLKQMSRASFIRRSAERALAANDIERFSIRATTVEQTVDKLSGGNQQKVVLSKWLATRPKILIMDEPTRGIDVGAKAEIHRLMSELARQGLAVLMISSELPEVLGMSDRILVLREGRLVAQFGAHEATPENVGTAMMSAAAGNTRLSGAPSTSAA